MGVTAITPRHAQLARLRRWTVRVFGLVSALLLALVLSGAIFELLPGIQLAHARGASMEPWLKDGDVVLLRTAKAPPGLRLGDVVLYHYGNIPVHHRVIEIGPDQGAATRLVVKGDNNPRPDKPVTLGDVEAVTIVKVPLLGEISRALGAGGGVFVYRYAVLLLDLAFVLLAAAIIIARHYRILAAGKPQEALTDPPLTAGEPQLMPAAAEQR